MDKNLKEYKNYAKTITEYNIELNQLISDNINELLEVQEEFNDYVIEKYDKDSYYGNKSQTDICYRFIKQIQRLNRMIERLEKIYNCAHEIGRTGYGDSNSEEFRCVKCGIWFRRYYEDDRIEVER